MLVVRVRGQIKGGDGEMKRGQYVFSHADPEIERLANKHYQEDPVTQKLVDDLLYGEDPEVPSGTFIQVPLLYNQ